VGASWQQVNGRRLTEALGVDKIYMAEKQDKN
jgi:hypothetical protein